MAPRTDPFDRSVTVKTRSATAARRRIQRAADRIIGIMRALVLRGGAPDRHRMIRALDFFAAHASTISSRSLVEALILGSAYHEKIGERLACVRLASRALAGSETIDDPDLRMRAHEALGVAYLSVPDPAAAATHLAAALGLAHASGRRQSGLAMAGRIVALLERMGLVGLALEVSVRLDSLMVDADDVSGVLRLQNAVNGLALGLQVGDLQQAARFFEELEPEPQPAFGMLDDMTIIMARAQMVGYLSRKGDCAAAQRILERTQSLCAADNLKAFAMIRIAELTHAQCAGDRSRLRRIKGELRGLLKRTVVNLPTVCEAICRALVDASEWGSSSRGAAVRLAYVRRYRAFLIASKYLECFSFRRDSKLDDGQPISNPTYALHLWFSGNPDSLIRECVDSTVASHVDQFDLIADLGMSLASDPIERSLRTADFEIAENWAVAADLRAGMDGGHCFRAGALAKRVALEMGVDEIHATRIEMACRLHDIGQIAVSEHVLRRAHEGLADEYLKIREHTTAGHELLSWSSDEILVMAARIARHHHEWWNGCGFPDGLRGSEIPLDARICAVVDSYLSLRRVRAGWPAWDHQAALVQISIMAGFRLDPDVTSAFLRAVARSDVDMDGWNERIGADRFVAARRVVLKELERAFNEEIA